MRKRFAIAALISFALSACSVRLSLGEAVADRLTQFEVEQLEESGQGASVPGTWFKISATLPRRSLAKIARWQLYPHMRLEDCENGETIGIVTAPQVAGTKADSFYRISELLEAEPRRAEFILGGPAFFQKGTALNRICLRLDGSSYTSLKIVAHRVPVRVNGT